MKFNHDLFKERLRAVTKGKKQKDIATEIGVAESSVSKWCNSRAKPESVPRAVDLLAISQKYGCSVDYLLGNDTATGVSVKAICQAIVDADRYFGIIFTAFSPNRIPDGLKIMDFCKTYSTLRESELDSETFQIVVEALVYGLDKTEVDNGPD